MDLEVPRVESFASSVSSLNTLHHVISCNTMVSYFSKCHGCSAFSQDEMPGKSMELAVFQCSNGQLLRSQFQGYMNVQGALFLNKIVSPGRRWIMCTNHVHKKTVLYLYQNITTTLREGVNEKPIFKLHAAWNRFIGPYLEVQALKEFPHM